MISLCILQTTTDLVAQGGVTWKFCLRKCINCCVCFSSFE